MTQPTLNDDTVVPIVKDWLLKTHHYAALASGSVEQFEEARIWVMDQFVLVNGELSYQPKWDGRINAEPLFRGMGLPVAGLSPYHPFRLLVEAFSVTTHDIIVASVSKKADVDATHRLMLLFATRLGACAWVKHQLLMLGVLHYVSQGDTLSELAMKYNTTVSELMKLNPTIENPDLIHVGTKLRIRV